MRRFTDWPESRTGSMTAEVPVGYASVWPSVYRLSGETAVSAEASSAFATLSKFNRIKDGLNYDQVARIMGCEGSEIGEESTSEGVYVVMLGWAGADPGTAVTVSFANGEVNSKSQTGLR